MQLRRLQRRPGRGGLRWLGLWLFRRSAARGRYRLLLVSCLRPIVEKSFRFKFLEERWWWLRMEEEIDGALVPLPGGRPLPTRRRQNRGGGNPAAQATKSASREGSAAGQGGCFLGEGLEAWPPSPEEGIAEQPGSSALPCGGASQSRRRRDSEALRATAESVASSSVSGLSRQESVGSSSRVGADSAWGAGREASAAFNLAAEKRGLAEALQGSDEAPLTPCSTRGDRPLSAGESSLPSLPCVDESPSVLASLSSEAELAPPQSLVFSGGGAPVADAALVLCNAAAEHPRRDLKRLSPAEKSFSQNEGDPFNSRSSADTPGDGSLAACEKKLCLFEDASSSASSGDKRGLEGAALVAALQSRTGGGDVGGCEDPLSGAPSTRRVVGLRDCQQDRQEQEENPHPTPEGPSCFRRRTARRLRTEPPRSTTSGFFSRLFRSFHRAAEASPPAVESCPSAEGRDALLFSAGERKRSDLSAREARRRREGGGGTTSTTWQDSADSPGRPCFSRSRTFIPRLSARTCAAAEREGGGGDRVSFGPGGRGKSSREEGPGGGGDEGGGSAPTRSSSGQGLSTGACAFAGGLVLRPLSVSDFGGVQIDLGGTGPAVAPAEHLTSCRSSASVASNPSPASPGGSSLFACEAKLAVCPGVSRKQKTLNGFASSRTSAASSGGAPSESGLRAWCSSASVASSFLSGEGSALGGAARTPPEEGDACLKGPSSLHSPPRRSASEAATLLAPPTASSCGFGQQKSRQAFYYLGEVKREKRDGWGMLVDDRRLLFEGQWKNDVVLGWYICYHEFATEFGYRELNGVCAVSVASDSDSFIVPLQQTPETPQPPCERKANKRQEASSSEAGVSDACGWGRELTAAQREARGSSGEKKTLTRPAKEACPTSEAASVVGGAVVPFRPSRKSNTVFAGPPPSEKKEFLAQSSKASGTASLLSQVRRGKLKHRTIHSATAFTITVTDLEAPSEDEANPSGALCVSGGSSGGPPSPPSAPFSEKPKKPTAAEAAAKLSAAAAQAAREVAQQLQRRCSEEQEADCTEARASPAGALMLPKRETSGSGGSTAANSVVAFADEGPRFDRRAPQQPLPVPAGTFSKQHRLAFPSEAAGVEARRRSDVFKQSPSSSSRSQRVSPSSWGGDSAETQAAQVTPSNSSFSDEDGGGLSAEQSAEAVAFAAPRLGPAPETEDCASSRENDGDDDEEENTPAAKTDTRSGVFGRTARRTKTCVVASAATKTAASRAALDFGREAEGGRSLAGEKQASLREGLDEDLGSAAAAAAEGEGRRMLQRQLLRRGATFPEFTTQDNLAAEEMAICEGVRRGGSRRATQSLSSASWLRASDCHKWSSFTLAQFLRLIGMAKEAALFKRNKLCGADIPSLTDADLERLGLADVYVRKFLLSVFRFLWSCNDLRDPLTPQNRRHLRRKRRVPVVPSAAVAVGPCVGGGGYATVHRARLASQVVACKIFRYKPRPTAVAAALTSDPRRSLGEEFAGDAMGSLSGATSFESVSAEEGPRQGPFLSAARKSLSAATPGEAEAGVPLKAALGGSFSKEGFCLAGGAEGDEALRGVSSKEASNERQQQSGGSGAAASILSRRRGGRGGNSELQQQASFEGQKAEFLHSDASDGTQQQQQTSATQVGWELRFARLKNWDFFRYCPLPVKHRDLEADILASLQGHPHIVALFGKCSLKPGEEALLLEYCAQGSFDNVVFPSGERRPKGGGGGAGRWRSLSRPRVVHFFEQVADGLAFVHSQQVLHRDLKLSNLLLADDGNARVRRRFAALRSGGEGTVSIHSRVWVYACVPGCL